MNNTLAIVVMVVLLCSGAMTESIAAQSGAWSCPDDGESTTIVSNQGTDNVTVQLSVTPLLDHDQSLKYVIYKRNSDGAWVEHDSDVITGGESVTLVLGPGMKLKVKDDPVDVDTKTGAGTYTVS
jgi:hypothetical protein